MRGEIVNRSFPNWPNSLSTAKLQITGRALLSTNFNIVQTNLPSWYCGIVQWRIQDFSLGGGAPRRWGVPTSDAGTFWWKCMRKQKNWILLGDGDHMPAAPPGSANVVLAYARVWGSTPSRGGKILPLLWPDVFSSMLNSLHNCSPTLTFCKVCSIYKPSSCTTANI